jgi:hypothetical protein
VCDWRLDFVMAWWSLNRGNAGGALEIIESLMHDFETLSILYQLPNLPTIPSVYSDDSITQPTLV